MNGDGDEIDKEFTPIKQYTPEEVQKDGLLRNLSRNFTAKQTAKRDRQKRNLSFFKRFRVGPALVSPGASRDGDGDETLDLDETLGLEGHKRQKTGQAPEIKPEPTLELELAQDETTAAPAAPAPAQVLALDSQTVQSTLRRQLISHPHLTSYQPQSNEVYNLLQNTVLDGEGNSALLIGPRGSGKTSLINKCIDQININHKNDYLLIRLNSVIHSDETSAVREIASQLSKIYSTKELDFAIELRHTTTTFRNVLRILDNNPLEEDQEDRHSRMAIVFVIDDLETFTLGNKQVLLYNLFDMTQSSKTPICILGTSTKFTTRELLEKRVRSRFSQRLIVLNKFGSFDDFAQGCLSNLKLNSETINKLDNKQYGEEWNRRLSDMIGQNSAMKKLMMLNFHTVRNIKQFNISALLPVSKVSQTSPFLKDTDFLKYYNNQMNNHIQGIVKSLSQLECLLVIAASRFIERSNLLTVNFNLAYKEYVEMIKRFNIEKTVVNSSSVTNLGIITNLKVNTKIYNASVLRNCWISLYRLGLIIDYIPNTAEGGVMVSSSNRYFVIEDTKMLQLDINLKEMGEVLGEGMKAFTRI